MGSDEAFPRDFDRVAADVIERHVRRMESHAVTVALRELARHLTIAAGLQRAYDKGRCLLVPRWWPGCGRSAL